MGLLTKSAIFEAKDAKFEDVEVPEWGGTVRVRLMTGAARDEWRTAVTTFEGPMAVGKHTAALLATTLIGEDGELLFSMEDLEALRAKSASTLDAVAAVAMRLNGIGEAAVGEAAKNSESIQSDDSGTDSPKS